MRVLRVEDDRMIGETVSLALRDAACAVDWVRDGVSAVEAARDQRYDLVLLDLGLPQQDGLTALRAIRKSGNDVPVLIVTARDAVDDRIAGLDAGADDYIVIGNLFVSNAHCGTKGALLRTRRTNFARQLRR